MYPQISPLPSNFPPMNQENTQKRKISLIFIAVAAFLIIGAGITFIGAGNNVTKLFSQFSGANTSPANAVTQWQPTPSNTYRTAVGTANATRLDGVVRSILSRGTALNVDQFKAFLTNVDTGVKTLAAKPAYVADQNVQNIVGYIAFELSDAKANITSGADFVTEMVGVIDGISTGSGSNTTSTPSTPTPSTITCSGNLPTTAGLVSKPYNPSEAVVGPSTPNATWKYASALTSCTWSCSSGYVQDGNNGCKLPTTTTPVVTTPVVTTPVVTECTGTLPTGPGIQSSGYSATSFGGGSGINTVWRHISEATNMNGCTWSCKDGYTREGNTCKAMAPGSGVTINVIDEATNLPLSGVNVSVIHSYCNATSTLGTYMTDTVGKTSEFYLPSNRLCGFIFQFEKSGYAIKSGTNCTSRVTGGNNYCDFGISYQNSNSVTVKLSNGTTAAVSNPVTVYTDSSLSTPKSTIAKGGTLYGYISGGDVNNTYGCLDIPGGNTCLNGGTWRQLTKPYNGVADGWQINNGRIELRGGMLIEMGYPSGQYTGYTRNGLTGTPMATPFTVQ